MTKAEIRIFEGLEALSWAAATRLEEQARIKAIEKKPFSVAVSGGSTPKLLFELLANPGFQGHLRWSNLQLFQVDERCVPPTDKDSNYRMTNEAMLQHVPLPASQIYRMEGELDPEVAAMRYEAAIRTAFRA